VVSYAKYLGKAWWPSRLSLLYPYQPDSLTTFQISLSVLLLVLISAGVVIARKRYLTVGWLWFLGTLVPMIGLVQVGVQAMADRYAYLPFIGIFIAVCWAVADFAQSHRISPKWLAAMCGILFLASAFATHRQIGYWSDDLTLWSHAATVTRDNYVAEDGIGNSLLARGELEQAMPHFQLAAAIHPTDPISNTNLAFYKVQHNDLAGGLAQYKAVTENAVDARLRANAFMNMGLIEAQLGYLDNARIDFQTAVNLRPRNVRAWIGLGAAAQRSGNGDAAVQAYSHAVELQATDVTYLLLAGALEQSGQRDAAAAATSKAIQLSQNIGETRQFVKSLIGP
jgi:Flp pilus assembly protein TadD